MFKRLPKATVSPRQSMVKLRALGTATATATVMVMVKTRLAVERLRKVSIVSLRQMVVARAKAKPARKAPFLLLRAVMVGKGAHDWNLSSGRSRRQRDDECIDHLNGKVTGDVLRCVASGSHTTKRGVDFNYPSG